MEDFEEVQGAWAGCKSEWKPMYAFKEGHNGAMIELIEQVHLGSITTAYVQPNLDLMVADLTMCHHKSRTNSMKANMLSHALVLPSTIGSWPQKHNKGLQMPHQNCMILGQQQGQLEGRWGRIQHKNG